MWPNEAVAFQCNTVVGVKQRGQGSRGVGEAAYATNRPFPTLIEELQRRDFEPVSVLGTRHLREAEAMPLATKPSIVRRIMRSRANDVILNCSPGEYLCGRRRAIRLREASRAEGRLLARLEISLPGAGLELARGRVATLEETLTQASAAGLDQIWRASLNTRLERERVPPARAPREAIATRIWQPRALSVNAFPQRFACVVDDGCKSGSSLLLGVRLTTPSRSC